MSDSPSLVSVQLLFRSRVATTQLLYFSPASLQHSWVTTASRGWRGRGAREQSPRLAWTSSECV